MQPLKHSTLIKLLNAHGLDYIKQLDDNAFKVYDAQLDSYAVVSYGYDKHIGYTIVSYTTISQ
jgi:hypothetical protein